MQKASLPVEIFVFWYFHRGLRSQTDQRRWYAVVRNTGGAFRPGVTDFELTRPHAAANPKTGAAMDRMPKYDGDGFWWRTGRPRVGGWPLPGRQ